MHVSRSRWYAMALERMLEEHRRTRVTERIDHHIAEHGRPVDPVFLKGSIDGLRNTEW